MGKNINVIVKKTQKHIGQQGSLVKLSAGYVFNYLIPNNIVEMPTKGKIKHLQMFNTIANKKQETLFINATNIKKQIESINKIQIIRKIGTQKSIFGSINEKDILKRIFYQTNQTIEKKSIKLPEIKNIGIFHIVIKLYNNETYNLKLQVIPSNI